MAESRCYGRGMKSIPIPIRERILTLYGRGKSTAGIASAFGFCVAAVRRVRQQFKERGTVEPQTHRCGRKTLLTAQRRADLNRLVADRPDATLAELGARMDRPFGTSTVDLWLRKLGLSFKKNDARRRTASSRRGRTKGSLARTTGGRALRPSVVRG